MDFNWPLSSSQIHWSTECGRHAPGSSHTAQERRVFSIIFTQSTIGAGIQFVWPIKLIRGCNIILYSLGWWWYPELCLYQRHNIRAKQDNPSPPSTIFQGPLNGFWSLENKLTRLGWNHPFSRRFNVCRVIHYTSNPDTWNKIPRFFAFEYISFHNFNIGIIRILSVTELDKVVQSIACELLLHTDQWSHNVVDSKELSQE